MKLLHQGNHKFRFDQPKKLNYPVHVHNALEIIVMERGSATVLCDKERYHMDAGDVFIAFPNRIHGYEDSLDFFGYLLIVPPHPYLTAYHSLLFEKVPQFPLLHRDQWESTGLLSLLEMAYRDRQQESEAVLQGYIQAIVGKLLHLMVLVDAKTVSADALWTVLMYVNSHYTHPLTRKDLAKATGYTESYISHLFSATLNTSLTEYLLSLRLMDAKRLLKNTDLSISEIAMQLGFGSIRSFNRAFAEQMGIPPKTYRQNQVHQY